MVQQSDSFFFSSDISFLSKVKGGGVKTPRVSRVLQIRNKKQSNHYVFTLKHCYGLTEFHITLCGKVIKWNIFHRLAPSVIFLRLMIILCCLINNAIRAWLHIVDKYSMRMQFNKVFTNVCIA